MGYDLLIRGGRLIDAAQGLDERMDIGISGGNIADVAPGLNGSGAAEVIAADGLIVVPGLIDFHAHAMMLGGLGLGTDLDRVCASTGVTTFIDGGSTGAATFPVFKEFLMDHSKTRLRAFLHISTTGIADIEVGESTYLDLHDPERAAAVAKEHPELIIGIKARVQKDVVGDNGLEPLRLAKHAASLAGGLPVMVHVTDPPAPLEEIINLLDPGDIVSHFLHGKEWGILGNDNRIHAFVIEARQRGIIFDVAHGRHHVDFNVAKIAIGEGFLPDTISTDLTRAGMVQTVKDLPHTLSKFLNLGMGLSDVIACATANPARLLGMADRIGTLQKGAVADIAVFALETGEFQFEDTEGNTLEGPTRLTPQYTVRQGQGVWQIS
jgi:dihydroorotase